MRFLQNKLVVLGVAAVGVVSLLAMGGGAAAQSDGSVVAEGLNGPMGVLVDPDGNVWLVDSGLGGDDAVDIFDGESGEVLEGTFRRHCSRGPHRRRR